MTSKPSLLFLSPVLPMPGGNGMAMRSGVFLEAYARKFDVTLLVLPLADGPWKGPLPEFVERHARRCEILPLGEALRPLMRLFAKHRTGTARRAALRQQPRPRQCLYDDAAARRLMQDRLVGQSFSHLHVVRLYMAPLAAAFFGRACCILDVDEDEVATRHRLAGLRQANGDTGKAEADASDADKFRALEAAWLPQFDLSILANAAEADRLARRNPGARFATVANAVRLPAAPQPAISPRPAKRFDLLMVGTLAYYPNADAALVLCGEIRAFLMKAGWLPRIAIVGRGPSSSITALAALEGVEVHADAADLEPFYASAAIAAVPLRAAGGSRIKILEAFAWGVPVVSTAIGAEGLDAVDGRHLLIADDAEDFAGAVLRLRDDPARARSLAAAARRLVEGKYRFEVVAGEIEALAALRRRPDASPLADVDQCQSRQCLPP
jgi:glycosyltransferase involved in cell wall biosynthesis